MFLVFDLFIALGFFLVALGLVSIAPDAIRKRLGTAVTQFSLRDLLWFVVVASLAACVYRERLSKAEIAANAAAQRRADERTLEQRLEDVAVKEKEAEKEYARWREGQKTSDAISRHYEEQIKELKAESLEDEIERLKRARGKPFQAKPGEYFLAPVRE